MMKDFTKDTVTERDVDQRYRRPASLSDWLPWVDYEEASETFTLEDGYSAAAMFEVTGVSTEARSESFLAEVQANIQTCINHTIPAHDNPFVLQCFVSDEASLSGQAELMKQYAQENNSQTAPGLKPPTEPEPACTCRHVGR